MNQTSSRSGSHSGNQSLTLPTANAAAMVANIDTFVAQSGRGHALYLKFNKGEFLFGIEENLVEPDERFAVNMQTLAKGFICWGNAQVLDEVMAPVISGKTIHKSDLRDFSDEGGEWLEQSSVEFTNLDNGDVLLFKTASFGGRNALANLAKAFADRIKSGADTIVPVVEMIGDSYRHKSYGKVHVPVFEVVDWLAPAGSGNGSGNGNGGDDEDDGGDHVAAAQGNGKAKGKGNAKGRVIDPDAADSDDDDDPFEEKPKRRTRRATKRTPV